MTQRGAYALGNVGNQVLARKCRLTLPQQQRVTQRLEAKRRQLESRGAVAQQFPD
jgi:hypothetical protein